MGTRRWPRPGRGLLALVGVTVGVTVVVALVVASGSLPRNGPTAVRSLVGLSRPGHPWVTTTELAAWMARPAATGPVLVDARAAEEFAVGHLAGARLWRQGADRGAIPDGRPLVVYCSLGIRSAEVVAALQRSGSVQVHNQVHNLAGGIFQWANEGRPLVARGRPVHVVHPFNGFWGLFLEAKRRAPHR